MHILVTNDDGPPSPASSPYVHSLVRELQKAGHTVSVCLPNTQRSWIGKAHIIGQTVTPSYYQPPSAFDPTPSAPAVQGTTNARPDPSGAEEWILVDGTPASAAQIGIHHFFQHKGPVDLVVSGPNYGRNTTAVFALSSGTLGGALEAAVCSKKAIALSYAFFSRNHDPLIIDAASRHAVRVIESLYRQWPQDRSVDLYTVNVPLVEGVCENKTLYTDMLQNYWGDQGGCFQEVEGSVAGEDKEEERIREVGEGGDNAAAAAQDTPAPGSAESKGHTHRHFKWAPRFADVYKSVEDSPPGNDGWAVKEGHTSVTPMKANFWHTATHLHGQELKLITQGSHQIDRDGDHWHLGPGACPVSLDASDGTGALGRQPQETVTMDATTRALASTSLASDPKDRLYALVAYEDAYVQPLIVSALQKLFSPEKLTFLPMPEKAEGDDSEVSLSGLLPEAGSQVLQITPYEAIDWAYNASNPSTCLVNSYLLRKALIRKHYLASTIEHWVAKRPESVLKGHVKRTEAFEVDYAEFLDDALIEAFDLRASLEKNAATESTESSQSQAAKEWWILKPSMSDRGQGIRLFSTMEELQSIFDGWEADEPSSDEEEEEEEENSDNRLATANPAPKEPHSGGSGGDDDDDDHIMASHLRHFVAQPYIHPPLLLPGDNRKFHIRTYVACVGSLDVYVYRHMLALFAGQAYVAPDDQASSEEGLEAHLTNTCLQRSVADGTVQRFWDTSLSEAQKRDVFSQICAITGEAFEAAAKGMMMHFRPLANAFELYGLDFLVDASGRAWLLEVNAFPDFKQTGDDLRGVVAGLWEEVLRVSVGPFFGIAQAARETDAESDLVHVRHVDLGSR